MEKFQKSSCGILRNMKLMEEFCDVTLVSEDDMRIRAHKVVLASASKLFRDLFQNYEEDTENQVIHMREVSSKCMVAMVDLVYNGEAQIEENVCETFLKTLKVYKILKVKSNEETHKIRCNFFNRGFCKAGLACLFYHPEEDCEVHMLGNICSDRACYKRHRTLCKYKDSKHGGLKGSKCMFLHKNPNGSTNQKENHVKTKHTNVEEFDKSSISSSELKSHLNENHEHLNICPICKKRFKMMAKLREHFHDIHIDKEKDSDCYHLNMDMLLDMYESTLNDSVGSNSDM
jgi:hypothetical protein